MKKSNEILSQLKTRKFKVGSLATALTVVVTAIIIVINLIVGQLTDKFSLSLDLTQNKIFSLTEQSINFIKNLDNTHTLKKNTMSFKFNTPNVKLL